MQALRDWATRDEKRKAHWWAIPTHVETDQQPSKPRSLLEAFLSVQCSAAPSHALRLPMIRRPSGSATRRSRRCQPDVHAPALPRAPAGLRRTQRAARGSLAAGRPRS